MNATIRKHTILGIFASYATNVDSHVRAHESYKRKIFRFLSVQDVQQAWRLLHIDIQKLQPMIETPEYSEFTIPKKKGGVRSICMPGEDLKVCQQELNDYLQRFYFFIKPQCETVFNKEPKFLKLKVNI